MLSIDIFSRCWLANSASFLSLLSTKGLLSLHSSLYSNQHFSLSFILTVVTSKVDFFQTFKRNSAPPQKVLLVYGQKIPIFLAHPPQKHVFQVGYQSKENWNFVPIRQKLSRRSFSKEKTKTREISQSFPLGSRSVKGVKSLFSAFWSWKVCLTVVPLLLSLSFQALNEPKMSPNQLPKRKNEFGIVWSNGLCIRRSNWTDQGKVTYDVSTDVVVQFQGSKL